MPAVTTASSSSSRKRITIKPFSRPPKLPPNFYETTSKQILEAVSWKNHHHHSRGLQNTYQSVVNLVSHQFGPRLYKDLVHELQKSTQQVLTDHRTAPILPYLTTQYPKYVDYLLLVRHVFLALDRPYVWETTNNSNNNSNNNNNNNNTTPSSRMKPFPLKGVVVKRTSQTIGLLEVGLQQFAARMHELQLDVEAYEAWWSLLWDTFQNRSSELSLLESTVSIWTDLQWKLRLVQQTQPRLEHALQQVSRQKQQTAPYSAESFLSYVHQHWMYVSQNWTFLPKTWLRTLLEIHLFEPHLNKDCLLHDLDINNLQHCQKLWLLSSRLEGGLSRVLDAVCKLVKHEGLACIQSSSTKDGTSASTKNANVVAGLLDLQDRLEKLQEVVGDLPLKPVWSEILNEEPAKVAELLAKHMDAVFRNSKTTATVQLEPILKLFCYLQAKDIFEAFYKKDLAKRLLLNKIQNMDIERQFVSLLKAECGAGYTSKMEGMFQDVEWSRETMARYRSSPEYNHSHDDSDTDPGVEMDVQILTTGYWPVYTQYPHLVLPPCLTTPQERFWSHYKQKYQGRKIVWQYFLGNCSVRFTTKQKSYDLIVSLCQTLVLLCFNTAGKKWTMRDISQTIGFDDFEELERIIQSLALGKEGTRVLRRVPAMNKDGAKLARGPSVRPDDAFCINEKFFSNHRRIRINNLMKKETKEERDKVVEGVSRDRLYLIDAVLVRIMKARKTILHKQLIPQVLEQIKVPAQPTDIKKRIESLIEREYMERDEKDRNRYNYLA